MKKILCVIISIFLIASSATLGASAKSGYIIVNGENFSGTFNEAVLEAGKGGVVEIHGTISTMPVGKVDGNFVSDVSILGYDDAKLVLSRKFRMKNDDNLDVLTIKGQNVVVKNLKIDARYQVDYALCIFPGTDNVSVENCITAKGIRGAVNVMSAGVISFKNVQANYGYQTGFEFENCDGTNITFENCTTRGNWYKVGIIVKNGYSDCVNIDASGITCFEDYFSFHDRTQGTISGGERAALSIVNPPKNSQGEPIKTDVAMYYPLEKAYQHIRYGVTEKQIKSAVAYVDSSAYGIDTRVYFDDMDEAEKYLHEGEEIVSTNKSSKLLIFILRVLNTMKIMIKFGI